MELGRISVFNQVAKVLGWLSIISGLIVLFIFNAGLLTNYSINLIEDFNTIMLISFCSAFITLFNKQHRSLGVWGFCIVLFCIFFAFGTFILGWMVVPFP